MDIISDMLTKIKNAVAVQKPAVDISFSNFKYEIARILGKNGFVENVEKKKNKIEINLKYNEKVPAISGIKRVSKPSQRIYLPYSKIKKVKGGYGFSIISTSKGLMTDKEARKQKVGGEIICEIW